MGLVIYQGPSPGGVEVWDAGRWLVAPKGQAVLVSDETETNLLQQGSNWASGADGAPVYTPPPTPRPRAVVVDEAQVSDGQVVVRDPSSLTGYSARFGGGLSNALGKLEAHGHSISNAGGARDGQGYVERLGVLLDATVTNQSVAGACAHFTEADSDPGIGGWARVLQDVSRAVNPAPYLPGSQVVVLHYGLNDLAALGPDNYKPLQTAMRAIIARYRAATLFEDTDASIAYASAGTQFAFTDRNSGTTMQQLPSGASATVSVPPDFPGGVVAVSSVMAAFDTTLTYTVDGTEDRTVAWAPGDVGAGSGVPSCERFTLEPGAHTIRLDVAGNDAYFDCWHVEAAKPPVVLVVLGHRCPTPGVIWTQPTWAYTPTDADTPEHNAALQAVVDEFDQFVVPVDIDTALNRDPSLFVDGVHPNDLGHALIAQQCYEALEACGLSLDHAALLAGA